MLRRHILLVIAFTFLCAASALFAAEADSPLRILDSQHHHLGIPGSPEWRELDGQPPEGPMLAITFTAHPNRQPASLFIHPRDIHDGFIPFAPANFNPVTGANLRGPEFTFDAVEVVNSGTLQSDFMQSYRDWFALLNHGYRITAVGSSDSHDVARFIVGQGRSLVVCDDRDPAHISIDAAGRSFKEGRVAVSLGLFTRISVDNKFEPGDLASGLGPEMRVNVRVFGPTWTRADKVELFADGIKIREQAIHAPDDAIEKASIEFRVPKPTHDVHLLAIASGPGVNAPYWPIPSPYQPTDRIRAPRVIGSTNKKRCAKK